MPGQASVRLCRQIRDQLDCRWKICRNLQRKAQDVAPRFSLEDAAQAPAGRQGRILWQSPEKCQRRWRPGCYHQAGRQVGLWKLEHHDGLRQEIARFAQMEPNRRKRVKHDGHYLQCEGGRSRSSGHFHHRLCSKPWIQHHCEMTADCRQVWQQGWGRRVPEQAEPSEPRMPFTEHRIVHAHSAPTRVPTGFVHMHFHQQMLRAAWTRYDSGYRRTHTGHGDAKTPPDMLSFYRRESFARCDRIRCLCRQRRGNQPGQIALKEGACWSLKPNELHLC